MATLVSSLLMLKALLHSPEPQVKAALHCDWSREVFDLAHRTLQTSGVLEPRPEGGLLVDTVIKGVVEAGIGWVNTVKPEWFEGHLSPTATGCDLAERSHTKQLVIMPLRETVN